MAEHERHSPRGDTAAAHAGLRLLMRSSSISQGWSKQHTHDRFACNAAPSMACAPICWCKLYTYDAVTTVLSPGRDSTLVNCTVNLTRKSRWWLSCACTEAALLCTAMLPRHACIYAPLRPWLACIAESHLLQTEDLSGSALLIALPVETAPVALHVRHRCRRHSAVRTRRTHYRAASPAKLWHSVFDT